MQEPHLCVLEKAYEWCSWACWNEKISKCKKSEGDGSAFKVLLDKFSLAYQVILIKIQVEENIL